MRIQTAARFERGRQVADVCGRAGRANALLLVGALLAALAAPAAANAQSLGEGRVGVLVPSTPAAWDGWVQIFRLRLKQLGWIEGQNLVLDVRYAEDRYERLPGLAGELAALKPKVIFAGAAAAIRAAAQAAPAIPIVFETLGDPMSLGLVTSLARPDRNMTGVSGFSPEQSAKRLALLREVAPAAKRVGVLANMDNPMTPAVVRSIEAAAQQLQVQLDVVDVRAPSQLEGAFAGLVRRRAGALLVGADPMLFGQTRRIVELAERFRLPAAYEQRTFTDRGGLLSYGQLVGERFQQAAGYVDRILRGAKPADLPIERPNTFELVVNLKAAKAIGVTVPGHVLLQADAVIR